MVALGGIDLNPILSQVFLYNVAGQLIGGALAPFIQAETNLAQSAFPNVPLSPADAAEAVIRNIMDEGTAAGEAVKSGVPSGDFHTLTLLAGNAPAPEQLAEALRRGFIGADRYLTGIRQGRLRDEWADLMRELAVRQPTPQEALLALVEGQLSEADARAKFAAFGGDPAQFDWLFGTVGAAPSPVEAGVMANRGVIPWSGTGLGVVSFDQAIAEGHSRTKWTDAYRALAEYLPPPRTVTAMHREGALTDAEAADLLRKHGLSPELAAAYLHASSQAKMAKAKELAESTVLALYRDKLVPRAEAATFIERLGYSAAQAEFILQVEDLAVESRFLRAAVGRVATLYVGHKITRTQAASALSQLKVDGKQADELLALWDIERAVNLRTLTPAQIEGAFGDGIIDQPEAIARLTAEGYTPHDAWLVLSVHVKHELPNPPPEGAVTPPAGP